MSKDTYKNTDEKRTVRMRLTEDSLQKLTDLAKAADVSVSHMLNRIIELH